MHLGLERHRTALTLQHFSKKHEPTTSYPSTYPSIYTRERESESECSKTIKLWGIQCEGYRHSGSFSINLKTSKYKNYGEKSLERWTLLVFTYKETTIILLSHNSPINNLLNHQETFPHKCYRIFTKVTWAELPHKNTLNRSNRGRAYFHGQPRLVRVYLCITWKQGL